jgi:hypothetical protein
MTGHSEGRWASLVATCMPVTANPATVRSRMAVSDQVIAPEINRMPSVPKVLVDERPVARLPLVIARRELALSGQGSGAAIFHFG